MKTKIFLVSLFLLAILTLGAASAAENVSADDLAVDDVGDLYLEVSTGEVITDGDAKDVAVGETEILSINKEKKLSEISNVIIVNNSNYANYFNQTGGGKLVDFIKPGDTLDIQGSIVNSNASVTVLMEINKPVNIISSTGDGNISLNSSGQRPIINNNNFCVTCEGSGSNITGISFYNTRIHIINATNVVLDKLNIINNQPMGAGATTFSANSTYVTLKNSYFFATKNGGSAPFTFAWADYCTLDNNTFIGGTNVPNFIYYFVPIGQYGLTPTSLVNRYNNFTNNKMYGYNGAKITLSVMGEYNLFENNTFENTTVGGTRNNVATIIGNKVIGGSLSGGYDSLFCDNIIDGGLTIAKDSIAYNNNVLSLSLGGADIIVHDNVINGATSINAATNSQIYDNTFIGDYTIKFNNANAKNITFANNDVIGNIEFGNKNAKGNKIVNNTITTSKSYAIDLKTYEGTETNITANILNSAVGFGNNAINHVEDSTLILDNYQNAKAIIGVLTNNIKVGETAVINITANETSITGVEVIVNGEKYSINLENGKGSLELKDLLSGSYEVYVTSADLTYGGQNSTSFEVNKNVYPAIIVDAPAKTQWIDSNITVTISDATGTVTLDINDSEFSSELVDGVVVFDVPDFVHGDYNYTITYSGDYKYFGNTTNGTLTVNKNKKVKIIASDVVVYIIADKFTAKFTNYIDEAIANANVTITVGDAIYPLVTDENGEGSVDLALTRGNYDVNVAFKDIEDEFDGADANYVITVIDGSVIKIISVDGDGLITGCLSDALGAPITNANIAASMGTFNATLTTDGAGLFEFKAQTGLEAIFKYAGDVSTIPANASITLNNVAHIIKDAAINASNVSCTAVDTGAGENGKSYVFTLKDAEGNAIVNKTVQVTLNGNVYTVETDANGSASVVILLSVAKTYNLNVFFIGDKDYKGTTVAVKITVTKKASTLKATKTKYIFKAKVKSKVIKATLKTSNKYLKAGKKVTIKIKGKTYTAKTGKNGAIKLKIKTLNKKGTYKAKIKFAGDSTYKASSSKTIKIVIK